MKKLYIIVLVILSSCSVIDGEFSLLNRYRVEGVGGHPSTHMLERSSTLDDVAQLHADYIVDHFSHTWADGTSLRDRLEMYGVYCTACAENIARLCRTEDDAIDLWMTKTGHSSNLMNPIFKKYGIANNKDYWVIVLTN